MSIRSVLNESNQLFEDLYGQVPVVVNGEQRKIPVYGSPNQFELGRLSRISNPIRIGITLPGAVYSWTGVTQNPIEHDKNLHLHFDLVFIWKYDDSGIAVADLSHIGISEFSNKFYADPDHVMDLLSRVDPDINSVKIGTKVYTNQTKKVA